MSRTPTSPTDLEDSEDNDGMEERFKRIEALNLIVPYHTVPPSKVLERDDTATAESSYAKEEKRLRGYKTLQELREKVGTFRKGYLNWRKFKPRGARGEGVDIISGRKESSGDLHIAPLMQAMESWVLDDKKFVIESKEWTEVERDISPPGSRTTRTTIAVVTPIAVPKHLEDEEAWLRFYFNPFTPAEEKEATVLEAKHLMALGEAKSKNNLTVPVYNRDPDTITDWIMHLGVGQFHRSHQLVYMDDLLTMQHAAEQQGSILAVTPKTLEMKSKWGYCGVGLMEFDWKMADALRKQDLLYTVLSRSNSSSAARVVGSMFDYIFAPQEQDRVYARMMDVSLRIISLTITEKGYCQNVEGTLNTDNQYINYDLQLLRNHEHFPPTCPKTAIGFIYLGLRERKAKGLQPFTVMSCDNLPENGHVARKMVCEFANRLDPEMSTWIADTIAFPSTMVDRITPQTVLEHREILAKDFGVADRWPVVTEDYRQWVIEDNFPCGRPSWESVSALLTTDVRPFELMKLRLLNGGHSMLAYVSYIGNYRFVDDATNDVLISAFLRNYMDEVTSTIKNVSIELERYKEKIVERFGNRMIKDLLTRVCEDGSTKFYNTVKDPLLELIEEQRHIHWSALGIAAWIVFLATTSSSEIKDGNKDQLIRLARLCLEDPRHPQHVTLFLRTVFGDALGGSCKFISHVSLSLFTLKRFTARTVLKNGGVLETIFHDHLVDCAKTLKLIDYGLSCHANPEWKQSN